MKIIIYQNREVYKEESKIGNDSENKVETLEFEFPEEYADFTKYIEFQIKGEKYVDLIEGNKYVVTREVAKYGKIKTQVVLKKNTENDVLVFKSDIFTLNVSNSINATENLVHTVGIDLIEKIVTKNSEQDVRLDALEADNIINKSNISNIQTEQTNQNNRLDSLELDNTTNKTDILNIKQEQITQNTNIQELQTDNTSNKSKIADLETKNAEQDNKIVSLETKNTQQDTSIQTNTESIEQLQAENTKLKKEINSMQIPGEATGNPIHLSDSSDMECEIVVKSNAEQETREGYNLLIPPATQTKNGVTFTVNDDNSITVNGTAEADASINFVTPSGSIKLSFEAGTYKLTGCPEGGSDTTYSLGMNLNTGTVYDTGNGASTTLNTDMSNRNVWLIVKAGTTVSNLTFYPMLIKGTEDKPYEPYGAMPSPDYPSPVKTVGQNVNELQNNITSQTANGITITKNEDGTSTANGTATADSVFPISTFSAKAETYTLSGTPTTAKNTYNLCFGSSAYQDIGSGVNRSFEEETEVSIYIRILSGQVLDNVVFKPKLEKGSKATPYSPYGQGSVEIDVCNKNEFDGIMEQGNISGTTGSNVTESACIRSKNYIKIRPSKSYFFEREGKLTDAVGLRFYDKDKNIISSATTTIGYGVKNKIFTTVANAYYMRFTDWTNDLTNKYLLAQSNVATDYIEHESYTKVLPIQKEFVKIGDVEDTFVKVDGKWYEAHYHPKIVFDGTENFILHTGLTNDNYLVVYKYITGMKSAPKNNLLSNYFVAENARGSKNCIYAGYEQEFDISIAKTIASTVDELKSKLAEWNNNGVPMELYYPLATPELIECTAEQEEILNSFYTYKNVTNVSMSGIGTLKVNYKKDLETLINNLLATSVAE